MLRRFTTFLDEVFCPDCDLIYEAESPKASTMSNGFVGSAEPKGLRHFTAYVMPHLSIAQEKKTTAELIKHLPQKKKYMEAALQKRIAKGDKFDDHVEVGTR